MFYETLAERCNRLVKTANVYVLCRRNRSPVIAKLDSGDRLILDSERLSTAEIESYVVGLAKSDRLVCVTVYLNEPPAITSVYWQNNPNPCGAWFPGQAKFSNLNFYNHADIISVAANALMPVGTLEKQSLCNRIIACIPELAMDDWRVVQMIDHELSQAGL